MAELKINASDYWTQAVAGSLYTDSDMKLFHISIPDSSVMVPILRETDQTIRQAIIAANKSPGFVKVAINAMFFGGTSAVQRLIGSIDPNKLDTQGLLVLNGLNSARTRSSPGTFYVRQEVLSSGYTFGFGDPPGISSIAFGGAGPLILNDKPYNSVNVYNAAAMAINPLFCEIIGEPGSSPNLTPFERNQCKAGNVLRSNSRFRETMDPYFFGVVPRDPRKIGKVTFAHVPSQSRLLFIVQKHGEENGVTIAEIRDAYIRLGAKNALFFDGSDSVTFFTNDAFAVEPDNFKDRAIPVAIGFV
jgi:hypothetical protein